MTTRNQLVDEPAIESWLRLHWPLLGEIRWGETPPILAHALKSGLGATDPHHPHSQTHDNGLQKGKSPGGQGSMNLSQSRDHLHLKSTAAG